MSLSAQFDLLTYLPGKDYQNKIQPYLQTLLPYMTRMRELVEAGNPVASHQAFKESTNYCRWPIRQMEYSFFIRHLPKKVTGLALDAGSGVTPFPYLLISKGWETIAADIEADQVALLTAYGKEAYGTHAKHLTEDLRAMHLPDQHFSLVTCVSVLEHLKHYDVPLALAELVRVCKPGGRLIISTDVFPIDHPYIPLDEGAFTDTKVELLFFPLAAAAPHAKKPFLRLLNRLKTLTFAEIEQFWAQHWQPDFWEGNRGYGAIGMVFDLPTNTKDYAALITTLKKLANHPLLSQNKSSEEYLNIIKSQHAKTKYLKNITQFQSFIEASYKQIRNKTMVVAHKINTHFTKKPLLLFMEKKSTLKRKIKTLIKPRLGMLYQYSPRKLNIPAWYHDIIELKATPSISIVTPSFNQGHFLEKTILSIKNQHYPALEYIIQDGGSNDNSIEVMQKYQTVIKHWESVVDQGQSNAINLGFKHATGDIMAYLNSDDILLPGTLHYIAQYFNKHPDVDVIYGHRILIDKNDLEIGRWIMPRHHAKTLSWADYIPQETLFWRKWLWEKSGGQIDENFRFAMDWDLLLRFREAGAKFVRLPRFLAAFRVHAQQKTSVVMKETGEQEMAQLRLRCHGRPVNIKEINKHLRLYQLQHVLLHKLYRAGLVKY